MTDQAHKWTLHEVKDGVAFYYRFTDDGRRVWTFTTKLGEEPGAFTGGYFNKSYVYFLAKVDL